MTGIWHETNRGTVFPWFCDQFGHMNVRWYAHHFDDGGFQIWSILGYPMRRMEEEGFHTVIARSTNNFRHEIKVGENFLIRTAPIRCGSKSCTLLRKMINADADILHATQESVEVFFDPETRSAVPIPDNLRPVIEANLLDPEEVDR